jgi:hypothetical protein
VIALSQRPAVPNIALLLGVAWVVIVLQLVADHWADTARTLTDMDDAMRLVEMRGFIDGHGWFNLHEARLGPPEGYDTHWSRLIDVGLAGMLWLFSQFTDAAFAERLMRTVWPMLWLIPTMAGAVAIAWRVAGRDAALIALVLTAVGLPAFQHFIPGRIDHHNVQIAIAVLLMAAVAWSDRTPWAAAAAGVLTGAAMAIGFEGLPYIVLAGIAMALRFIISPDAGRSDIGGPLALDAGETLTRYGVWGAGGVAAAFLVSVGPAQWGHTACDAIAVNSTAAVILATAGLALVGRFLAATPWQIRAGGVAGAGLIAAVAFAAIEPRCLGGPFAMMDPAVRALWFNHVSEMQSLLAVASKSPPAGAAIAAFPAVALVFMVLIARDPATRRDFGFLVAAAALVISAAVMVSMVRAFSYAIWLAIPIVAAGVVRMFASLRPGSLAVRALIALFLTPAVTAAVAMAAVQAVTARPPDAENSRVAAGCLLSTSYAQLASLPPGLVATDIDYGPFVLALTPHSVMSAPYHRMVGSIIAANNIFALPPAQAREVVAAAKPDYLAVCDRHTLGGIGEAERDSSLWGRLAAGEVPPWLELVEETRNGPFVVYRVKR